VLVVVVMCVLVLGVAASEDELAEFLHHCENKKQL
jgi:hypothetical protein